MGGHQPALHPAARRLCLPVAGAACLTKFLRLRPTEPRPKPSTAKANALCLLKLAGKPSVNAMLAYKGDAQQKQPCRVQGGTALR